MTPKQQAAMRQALEALEIMKSYGNNFGYRRNERNPYGLVCDALESLREALAEPVQESVIYYGCHEHMDAPGLEEDFEPDACVLDEGRPSKCAIAFSLYKQGKNQTECEHWKPIKVMFNEKNT